jgi:hypothetical protein
MLRTLPIPSESLLATHEQLMNSGAERFVSLPVFYTTNMVSVGSTSPDTARHLNCPRAGLVTARGNAPRTMSFTLSDTVARPNGESITVTGYRVSFCDPVDLTDDNFPVVTSNELSFMRPDTTFTASHYPDNIKPKWYLELSSKANRRFSQEEATTGLLVGALVFDALIAKRP